MPNDQAAVTPAQADILSSIALDPVPDPSATPEEKSTEPSYDANSFTDISEEKKEEEVKTEKPIVVEPKVEPKAITEEQSPVVEKTVETIPKENYDELRSFVDRTITKVSQENKKLLEQLKSRPEPLKSKEYVELESKHAEQVKNNEVLAKTLAKIREEYDLDLDQYAPEQPVKTLTVEDIDAVLERRLNPKQETVEKEEEVTIAERTILDYMGKKGLLEKNGSVGERGRNYLVELNKLNPPEELNSDLFEKMLDAYKKVSGNTEVSNEVKAAAAQVIAGIAAPVSNTNVQSKGDDPLDDLMNQRAYY